MNTTKISSTKAERALVGDCVEQLESRIGEIGQKMYERLFELAPPARAAFKGSAMFRQRKFANLLITFRNVNSLDKMMPAFSEMGKRHRSYHRQFQNFMSPMRQALLETLAVEMGEGYTPELATAWEHVYDDVAAIMVEAAPPAADERRRSESRTQWTGPERRESWSLREDDNLLSDIGGEEVIRKVHQAFYDRMFEDTWLGQFFYGKSKEVLVRKQTQFMVSAFGGPYVYRGDTPAIVHMNMFITDELASLRERFLRHAILSQGLSESIADRWQAVDRLYRPSVVKQTVDDCVVTCFGQFPVEAKKPADYKEPNDLSTEYRGEQDKNAA
ncbi:MAG: globin domain-containing protein [Nitrospira sp.]|nr:globin domain-containing protein [Nitrospira sp.]